MKDAFILDIQAEDPSRGTLSVTHVTEVDKLNSYHGPLGRIIISSPGTEPQQFVAPVSDFIIMLAQFIQQYRGIE